MAAVENLQAVISALRAKAARYQGDMGVSVVVGYTAGYGVYVHENLEAVHGQAFNVKYAKQIAAGSMKSRGPNQQAKFLTPARQLHDEFRSIVANALKDGKTVAQALLLCGLRLQRESMKIVPVDTGNLRASAFTRLEIDRNPVEEHKGETG